MIEWPKMSTRMAKMRSCQHTSIDGSFILHVSKSIGVAQKWTWCQKIRTIALMSMVDISLRSEARKCLKISNNRLKASKLIFCPTVSWAEGNEVTDWPYRASGTTRISRNKFGNHTHHYTSCRPPVRTIGACTHVTRSVNQRHLHKAYADHSYPLASHRGSRPRISSYHKTQM